MFQDCPEGQKETCLTYEYCRELPRIPRIVAKWRKSSEWQKFQEIAGRSNGIVAELFHLSETALPGNTLVMLMGLRDFPKRPFLSIAIKEREKWLLPRQDIILCEFNPALLRKSDGTYQHVKTERMRDGALLTFMVCAIPWSYSNAAILAAFEKWLLEKRKELSLSDDEVRRDGLILSDDPLEWPANVPEEARGRNELRSKLKKLGALRLLRSMTTDDAATHTQKILGYPLYSRDTAWERARREAEKSLQEFSALAPPTANG